MMKRLLFLFLLLAPMQLGAADNLFRSPSVSVSNGAVLNGKVKPQLLFG